MTSYRTWRRGPYTISTDPARVDVDLVHRYLAEDSYWAEGVPREVVERSIEHSLVFGLYEGERQVGFARVVTDRATFAWLADVFVLKAERGQGLGKWLVECVMQHPDLRNLRRWMLGTRDAQELYRRFGFAELAEPGRFMEVRRSYR
jgi:GNAT superfamily N-acetyltransferase